MQNQTPAIVAPPASAIAGLTRQDRERVADAVKASRRRPSGPIGRRGRRGRAGRNGLRRGARLRSPPLPRRSPLT